MSSMGSISDTIRGCQRQMGPVVDNEHPFISSGDIDISYEALFHEQVAEIAVRARATPSSDLVPSQSCDASV